MLASDLVKRLNTLIDENGDLDVMMDFDPDYSIGVVEDVDVKDKWCVIDNDIKTRIVINC